MEMIKKCVELFISICLIDIPKLSLLPFSLKYLLLFIRLLSTLYFEEIVYGLL